MKNPLLSLLLLLAASFGFAQSKTYDIPVNQLPVEVKKVLTTYCGMLQRATSLDELAESFTTIAGGSLVNESAQQITLRESVKPYSLKKDYAGIKFYADPIIITRVNSNPAPATSGFGESAIQGRVYKIWIAKASGQAGLPAPISIMVPEGHASITSPKVIGIGSL